jgi:hypothetical protein
MKKHFRYNKNGFSIDLYISELSKDEFEIVKSDKKDLGKEKDQFYKLIV